MDVFKLMLNANVWMYRSFPLNNLQTLNNIVVEWVFYERSSSSHVGLQCLYGSWVHSNQTLPTTYAISGEGN